MIGRSGLQVAEALASFIDERVLPGTRITPERFWGGLADILVRFTPENRALLAERERMQSAIDAWCQEKRSEVGDSASQAEFLRTLGYLVDAPPPFTIDPPHVDDEVARIAGPQLVVPVLNARFLLNAANARWGSLYDALYGTDAIAGAPAGPGYDPARGAAVIARAKAFLDQALPLANGSWAELDGSDVPLADPGQYVGATERSKLFRNNGLHIEVAFDSEHAIGRTDPAGIADVILESALTTIVDFEDSIAAVDAEDKVAAYANWLGLMQGNLEASFDKGGRSMSRRLAGDRHYLAPDGTELALSGRSLLFVRNVGHLMTTPAVRLPDGSEAPEGIVDAVVTSTIALHDLLANAALTNSRAGSIYIVKPKMHGPAEADFANRLFDAVEDLLGLDRYTIKLGLMDEERRTSANLAACIHAVRHRIVFINTGFLDRTGDEIRTSTYAGAMIRKGEMRAASWFQAYEDRNVQIGLACGFAGRAQIGKGMWAAPDRMADMIAQKIGHPQAGASAAWVPSPTAATLHAMHYHLVDVAARQAERAAEPVAPVERLLSPPLAPVGVNWSADAVREELDNNAQGILGYVVRWIDAGIGCSKVPDIHDVGLMEDRATLRISSQHIANWLLHGVCSAEEVDAALRRMAGKVDAQNQGDPAYRPLLANVDGPAFQVARALVFEGVAQPSGYTEPLLHAARLGVKG